MEDEISDLSANESWGGESYNSSFETKNISGYNVGIGYESKLGERLSLETGFKYIKRGYKVVSESSYASSWDNYEETSTNEAKIKMNYLDPPVVLNTAILTGDFRLYARTGIFAGYLASARYLEQSEYNSSDGGFESYEYNEKMDASDMDDRLTGGVILGAGAEYKGFYFESNYNFGVGSFEYIGESYTHDISFNLGYKIKFNQ